MEVRKIDFSDLIVIDETIENAGWGFFCNYGVVCGFGCFGVVCL